MVTLRRLVLRPATCSAVEESRTFDSEGEANQTLPQTLSLRVKRSISSLARMFIMRTEMVFMGYWFMMREECRSGLQYHDGRRRKRVRLNEVQLQRFPAHCCPSQPSDTETSSSDSDVPLTIPKDAELVKYSVIDAWNSRAKHCHQ